MEPQATATEERAVTLPFEATLSKPEAAGRGVPATLLRVPERVSTQLPSPDATMVEGGRSYLPRATRGVALLR